MSIMSIMGIMSIMSIMSIMGIMSIMDIMSIMGIMAMSRWITRMMNIVNELYENDVNYILFIQMGLIFINRNESVDKK